MRTAVAMAVVFLLAATAGSNAVAQKGFDLTDVNGRYQFSFDGEILGAGPVPLPVAASGYLVADGKGSIDEARRTISGPSGVFTQTFKCTVEVDADGMGSASCPLGCTVEVDADGMDSVQCLDEEDLEDLGLPSKETFRFVIARDRQSFRFVGTTPGFVVSGTGHR